MKKTTVLFASVLSILMLCSCGNSSEINADINSDNYALLNSPSAIAEDAAQAFEKSYQSFFLGCDVPDASDFAEAYYHIDYDWNAWTNEECLEKVQAALMLEGEEYQEAYLNISKEDLGGDLGEVSEYHYESDTLVFGIAPTAYRTYFIRKSFTPQTAGRDRVGCYRINQGETIDGISYTVSGENYLLTDAVDYCNEYLASLKDILGYESASLRKIFVYQLTEDESGLEKGDCVYYLYYEKTQDGVTLESDCTTYWDPELPAFDEPQIVLLLAQPDQIAMWYDQSTKHVTNKEALEGVLPLSYALDKLESEVAEYSNYKISAIELNYATLQWQWDSSTFYYEPYWCIRLASGAPRGGVTNTEWDPCTMAYVNAVTGDCYVVSSIPGIQLSMDQYFENPEWDPETNPEAHWRVKQ